MAEKHEHVFAEDGDYIHAAGECEICGLHYRDYIKQLRAREAALVEIAEAVAGTFAMNRYEQCAYCDAEQSTRHTPDCPVTKARALLQEGEGQ